MPGAVCEAEPAGGSELVIGVFGVTGSEDVNAAAIRLVPRLVRGELDVRPTRVGALGRELSDVRPSELASPDTLLRVLFLPDETPVSCVVTLPALEFRTPTSFEADESRPARSVTERKNLLSIARGDTRAESYICFAWILSTRMRLAHSPIKYANQTSVSSTQNGKNIRHDFWIQWFVSASVTM